MHTFTIKKIKNISIYNSLFSGQTFSWKNINTSSCQYISVIDNNCIIIEEIRNEKIRLSCSDPTINSKTPEVFFDWYFSTDILSEQCFPDSFPTDRREVWNLVQPCLSVRILRQDFFQVLVTFMCAQGIGMDLIRRQVEQISRNFGTEHWVEFNDEQLCAYSFPLPETLAQVKPEELKICTNNNCTRARNIILAARAVEAGVLDYTILSSPSLSLAEIRERLCKQPGIGYKIADCIMLFGLHRFDAFPIDTHVHQYLREWFHFPEALKSLTPKVYLELQRRASALFAPGLAGYAGHILFHCWRRNVKNLTSC
ncbi:MAG: DNA-3-methyladenine glycosylase 2 [Prosthecochloris sp.]|nr:DNA-3-methyladenine glycosylase 2 [Prosthecochloris sp.]